MRLSHYDIGEQLSCSQTRWIVRAVRRSDQRDVVIKTSPSAWPSRTELERYRHEYAILQKLSESPHTPVPLALDREDGRLIVVIEAFDGHVLESLLDRPLDVARALRIGSAIADAIADIHEHHVIHKDIKPSNILIDRSGERAILIDFGIASLLTVEYKEAQPPGMIEGTLAYMSPEQTGRMNRGIDYRSDLYSFGITLYRMLTGQLPFSAADPLAWCHCHLAQPPRPPHELRPELPPMVVKVLDKLLAKAAEDRYQSAEGCAHDLRRCLEELRQTGGITSFPLAQCDNIHGFRIPAKLYGREREASELLQCFQQTAEDGRCRLVLVAGYSGIGKSSLVRELHKPVTATRGRFLAGKCDQYERDVPYQALLQAFQSLIQQILAEGGEVVAEWRERILGAVGGNGRVITSVLPELERIIGPQPPLPELGPSEMNNLFGMVVRNFIRVMARADSPLAIFLDDVQWSDDATLQLLRSVLLDASIHHICVILAYRDNEVDRSHPLALSLDTLERAGFVPVRIPLGSLAHDSIEALLAGTLRADPRAADVRELTSIVAEKTAGNPFFVIQFLTRLYEDGLVVWDQADRRFRCDVRQVAERGYTANVVEHMVQRLRLLQPETLDLLQTAACIGNRFEVADLCVATGLDVERVRDGLWPAVAAGLLMPASSAYKLTSRAHAEDEDQAQLEITYRFLHDRVQQAAYSLLDDASRQAIHLRIGRAWRSGASEDLLDERVFAISGQLNLGRVLIDALEERVDLVHLNLHAAHKAKSSTAYASAVHHLEIAAELLPEDCWQKHYQLASRVYRELAECRYLNGEFEAAEALFRTVMERAHTAVEKAHVYGIYTQLYQLSGNYEGGLALVIEALSLFDIAVPRDAETLMRAPGAALAEVEARLGDRRIADLASAPLIRDPEIAAIVQLVGCALPCAYSARPEYFGWFVTLGVDICLQHGIARQADILFVSYAVLIAHVAGDLVRGYEYSRMALAINERLDDRSTRGAVWQVHLNGLCYWNRPVPTYIEETEQAFLACQEVGDLVFAGITAFQSGWLQLDRSNTLSGALREIEKFARFIRQHKNDTVLEVLRLQKQYIACLCGNTESLTSLNGDGFDMGEYLRVMEEAGLLPGQAFLHVIRQILHYYVEEYAESLAHARATEPLLEAFMGQPAQASHYLYKVLALCALYPAASPEEQEQYRGQIEDARARWKSWAETCPPNFASRWCVMEAEIARIDGDPFGAMTLYERAVREARERNSVPDEGLACLAASRFHRAHGLDTGGRAYARAAAHHYERWGATGLVDRLFPDDMRMRDTDDWHADEPGSATSSSSSSNSVDTVTILKAAQAISSELQLGSLVQRLLTIAMENAGADHVRLLLIEDGADITVFSGDGRSCPLAEAQDVARSVISLVQRTGERVLIEDAQADPRHGSDPHIIQERVRSLLCLPIINQGRLRAMLYLENRLLASVFTPERASMLNLLSSQAAISMENAALYTQLAEHNRTLEEKVAQRTAELQRASHQAEEARRIAEEANTAKSRFLAHVSHEVRTTLNAIMGTTSLLQVSELSAEQAKLAHIIHRSCEGMLQLLNDLLDLSKIEAGKMELDAQPFELHACINDVVELLSHVAERKGIRLDAVIRPDVPSAMVGDAMRLRQILLNLLSNAIKFTEQGMVELRVEREPEDRLHFTIRDTGIGIPQDRLDAIFSTFTQAEASTAHRYGGSGLGLAICKQFVQLMRGRIWADSTVGEGTTFHVVIDARLAPSSEAADTQPIPEAPDADPAPVESSPLVLAHPPSSLRVLLVEDNIVSQKIACKMLAKLGCERVEVAEDGRQAVAKIRERAYDLVLMDIMMPAMDGLEATRVIRNDAGVAAQPKIVGMTANVMADDIDACRRAGMDDYLSKPVTIATLQAALARTLADAGG